MPEFSKKKLPLSKLEIAVTMTQEEVQAFERDALAVFQKEVSAEGFRRGHVPADAVKERVGKEQLLAKTVELAIQSAYKTVLKEDNLNVLGQPEITLGKAEEGKPLQFHIRVSLLSEVTLPNYKKIASLVEKKEAELTEEEIGRTLQWLKESRKKEDGTLPELTDEFARSLGSFENAEKLKESVKEGLRLEKQAQERNRLRQEIVEKIAKEAKVEVPEVLVQQEQDAMLEQTKSGVKHMMQMEFAEYLQSIKKTEEQMRESLATQALSRIKQFLVLNEIAKQEEITPTPEEVEAESQKVLRQFPDRKTAEQQFDPTELKVYSEGVVRNEKTLQFLEELAQ